ncbi:hypothetical protein IHE45_15G006000 [Dioscorea alata]|uniref:Uncharacterized protein n=1 Tax=Dioscorea alata TaxID=55571 RepID=A0ACB7UJP0_DIOAL|nr:hypothetical protein IHE45_15G006000 [Dioscorea alata]
MQTLQTNHMPSTMSTTTTTTFSNNSGHRRMGSSELDVFEASRYFSGDMDSLPLGFGSWSTSTKKINNYNINKKKSLELIPTQHQQQEEVLLIDHEKQNKLEKKRASSCKSLNSPTAKLANYLNSFLLQRSSKKKSINSKSNNKSMQSLKKGGDDYDHHLHHHESISFRSYSDCSKSYSSCVFGTPISQSQTEGIGERRARTISNHYINERRINGEYRLKKVGDEVEVEDDGESDASSDLFELRNMEDIGDGPNDLPVYGATSFEVAIASAILL